MKTFVRFVAMFAAVSLFAAGCADEDDNGDATATTAEPGTGSNNGQGGCESEVDTSLDEEHGEGAGEMQAILDCAAEQPLVADGDPIEIGLLNHEGDPAGSFPEYSAGVRAAIEFINNELGGVGGDVTTGTPGRPLELVSCFSTISPTEATSCANEVAAEDPFSVFVGLNFFGGSIYDIFTSAAVPVYVGSAISIADFISPDVLSIGPGGGCIGVNVGEVDFAVNELGARNIMTAWADTPPGVVCYHDSQKKPLSILAGDLTPTPPGVMTVDGLEYDAISYPPGTADLTPVATQVLNADPDAVLMTVAASDCWNFVSALYAVGYDPESGPSLVFNDACNDPERISQAGDQANGINFVGPTNFAAVDRYEGLLRQEVEQYEANLDEYEGEGAPRAGLGFVGFTSIMSLWQMWSRHADEAGGPDAITPESARQYVAATTNHHAFGGFPLGCADAVEPYIALCNTHVEVAQWTGDEYEVVAEPQSYLDLIAGTELDPAATGG